jgi:maltooligosyltrehalose trehalohydrolase
LDGLWADDLHHQVRVCVAGDDESYFANYTGGMDDLVETIRKGWFYCGQKPPGGGEPRGTNPLIISKMSHFVV